MRLVDTSVVVKWAVQEEGSEAAFNLYGTPLAAPDLLKAELANALSKKVRRDEATALQVVAAYAQVLTTLQFLPTQGLEHRALEIALELSHPAYDCFFLALAESAELTLISADLRLVKRCAGTSFAALVEPLA